MTYAIERMFEDFEVETLNRGILVGEAKGEARGKDKGYLQTLIRLIEKKLAKNRTRDEIINELELEEADIKVLDNLDTYRKRLLEESGESV
jgi:predicted transposase YdaD